MSPCPSPATLGRLALAPDVAPGFAAAEAHVESCPRCQDALERLAAEPSTCDARGPGRLPPPEQPPAIPGFEIEGRLGRGGMGVVYRAWQPRLGRRVAIKVVGGSPGIGAEDRRRWLREARAIGRVRHRNIVQIYDAGEQDGCLYLVLELIPGGSLAERLGGPLPARVAAGLMETVARAVEHLHEAGIVHLDLKPSNILLDGPPEGRLDEATPMVTDFGIAHAGDDAGPAPTGPFAVGGTPSFMAPEQIAGEHAAIGPRCDVFALGANLYTLLTGRPPFQGASAIETLDSVRTREPAPPRALVPGVPRDLETIALTCLRKDPRRRYATAGALADDLRRHLDGFAIRARPASKLEHAARWCRRRPALASLLTAFAITVSSSLVGLLALWRHSEAERGRAEGALARAVASDKATSRTVRELLGLLTTTLDSPQLLVSERLENSARVVLDLTAILRQDRGVAAANVVAICELERRLAEDFRRRGKYAEARELLADNFRLLEQRRGEADDPDVDLSYALSLMQVGLIAEEEDRLDEALPSHRRAEEVMSRLGHDPTRLEAIFTLDMARMRIAALLARQGQDEPRRRLLESHSRMLEQLSEDGRSDPAVALLAALARSELAPDLGAGESLRAAIGRFPADRRLPARFEGRVAERIAADVDPYPTGAGLAAGPEGRFDPEAHAASIIRAIEARCEALGIGPAALPISAYHIANSAAARASTQRRAGRLDDARRTVASLSAFAKALVRRDPGEAMFHVLLCQAFEQESKNAWRVDDRALVEETLRKALGEARLALQLAPGDMAARMKVSNLQDKLAGLESDPPASR